MRCSLQIYKARFLLEIHHVFDCYKGSFNQNTKGNGWSQRSLTKSNVNPYKKKIPVSRENLLRLVILSQRSIDPTVKYTLGK